MNERTIGCDKEARYQPAMVSLNDDSLPTASSFPEEKDEELRSVESLEGVDEEPHEVCLSRTTPISEMSPHISPQHIDMHSQPRPFSEGSLPSQKASQILSSSNAATTQTRRRRAQPQHFPSLVATSSSPPSHSNNNLHFLNETIEEESEEEDGNGGLRSSLDAGMAAVRRWIRSRTSSSAASSSLSNDNLNNNYNNFGLGPHQYDPSETEEFLNSSQPHMLMMTRSPPTISEDGTGTYYSGDENYSDCDGLQTDNPRLRSSPRQRALSEPDASRIREVLFQRALNAPQRGGFRRRRNPSSSSSRHSSSRRRSQSETIEMTLSSSPLSSSAADALYTTNRSSIRSSTDDTVLDDTDLVELNIGTAEPTTSPVADHMVPVSGVEMAPHRSDSQAVAGGDSSGPLNISVDSGGNGGGDDNGESTQQARARWIAINHRFQMIITVVAIIFSLLLFSILVCWVVLTSAYVVSIDKSCDVPLKAYFWMVTLQLILDVFRADIMRLFFNWDTSGLNRRIPCRIILYNIAYLTYAILVLRTGIKSVFMEEGTTCRDTASELFHSSTVFVILSIAAWATIILGYLVPFLVVASLLTWNGYTPTSDANPDGAGPFSVFPGAMGAPPGCVDQLRVVVLEDFAEDYPQECCICMEDFVGNDTIVVTECHHVFHKSCCREWLRQARTCPVCRMDIPEALEQAAESESEPRQRRRPRLGFGPTGRSLQRDGFHQEILRILRRRDRRRMSRAIAAGTAAAADSASPQSRTAPAERNLDSIAEIPSITETESSVSEMEQGRPSASYRGAQ